MSSLPANERIERASALDLLTRVPMGELMACAHAVRQRLHPLDRVTYVRDTNPNYTNICVTGCRFCAFYRRPTDQDAYTLTPEQLAEKARCAYDRGARTILLQGGHNPAVHLKDWLAYIEAVQCVCPGMHIHPFSPAEYLFMALQENTPVQHVLQAVYDAGVRTMPGGGAEVLVERVRQRIAPGKATTEEWLAVSEAAHRIGFRTTATLMYGHVERDEDIVDHLLALRDLQDKTGGFASFIAWSFKPGRTALGNEISHTAHPAKYVRIIALARLVLDNFNHIQSSWFSENTGAGQLGLLAGADDFGGILVEEHVLKQAGHDRSTTEEKVQTIIRRAGFTPALRDSFYNTLHVYDPPPLSGSASAAT